MEPGAIIDGRFAIEEEAGRGGMGVVYRAKDLLANGEYVALKLMPKGGAADRFARESKVLARLHHPAIVRHVKSGETEDGLLYLAMEWLEGEELTSRFDREGLSVADALVLTRRIADALGAAHALGVVHRDVKPSNIWLVEGQVEKAKLLDFGIASISQGTRALTATGAFIGTLGYVAPEHADGSRDIDGRADIFSLGCVLYECLTGQAAFTGDHPLEILAKAMLEGVPDVRSVRPNIDPKVAALVSRMTARIRSERFQTCAELEAAIDAIALDPSAPAPTSSSHVSRLSAEQRLVCLALLVSAESTVAGQTTVAPLALEELDKKALALVRRFGGEMRALSNGLLVTLSGGSSALDLAVNATRCALALKALHPDTEAVLATGRMDARFDASAVVTQALALLEKGRGLGLLRVDETTASLISSRFVLRDEGGLSIVVGRSDGAAPVRTLIGKPMPCVGRDKELGLLEATLDECIEESVARVVLVTAPPGTGKSRLRFELTERIEASRPDVRKLAASADVAQSGSALSVAAALVLDAAGVSVGATREQCFEAIRKHVAELFEISIASPPSERDRVATLTSFIAELSGVPSAGPTNDLLASARNEPRIMNEWMQRSFEEWMAAETRRSPVLLILEDMHWADESSLSYIAGAVKRGADTPLMVLGLARPEIDGRMPEVLAKLPIQEVRLGGLTRRAAERLVRFALPLMAANEVTEIVERADGNAFFLEELIRWAAKIDSGDSSRPPRATRTTTPLPETILMMLQSRIEKLPTMARRVLRAASVFGGSAWTEGVGALIGGSSELSQWIESLVAEEIVVHRSESRFPGKEEVGFRHGLLREAAYAMLTVDDRIESHRLAAKWLEAAGERDPLILAEHHSRAGNSERAAPLFLRAAQLAADSGNLTSALALSERGLDHGASGETRALLLATRAHAHGWRAQWKEVLELAPQAMELLVPGTVPWWLMAGGIVFASSSTADLRLVPGIVQRVLTLPGEPEATGPCGFAMTLFTLGSMSSGRSDIARAFAARCERMREAHGERDQVFAGWLRLIRDAMALYVDDDPAKAYRQVREGVELFDAARDPVGLSLARVYEGTCVLETGDAAGAEIVFRDAERLASLSDVRYSGVIARAYLARALVALGKPRDALALAEEIVSEPDFFLSSLARAGVSEAHMALGNQAESERAAELVMAAPATISLPQTVACSVLARLALTEGKMEAALLHAERGLTIAKGGAFPRCRSELQMAQSQALSRSRRGAEALVVQAEARARVERIAAGLALAGYTGLREAWLKLTANRLAMM